METMRDQIVAKTERLGEGFPRHCQPDDYRRDSGGTGAQGHPFHPDVPVQLGT